MIVTGAVWVVVAAALVSGLVVAGGPSGIKDKFAAPPPVTHGNLNKRLFSFSSSYRTPLWSQAWHEYKAHPIVGAGPEHELVLPGTPSERAAGVTRISRFAHNEYLQVASGAGIVGMALLALLLATIGRAVTGSDPASAAVRAALVVLAVGALFDFAWHLPALGITAGWIASLSGRKS